MTAYFYSASLLWMMKEFSSLTVLVPLRQVWIKFIKILNFEIFYLTISSSSVLLSCCSSFSGTLLLFPSCANRNFRTCDGPCRLLFPNLGLVRLKRSFARDLFLLFLGTSNIPALLAKYAEIYRAMSAGIGLGDLLPNRGRVNPTIPFVIFFRNRCSWDLF